MEGKPLHYDGSIQHESVTSSESNLNETLKITDEIRKNISGNPYFIEN